MDQRKKSNPTINAIRAKAGREHRSDNVFVPRPVTAASKKAAEQARIDLVVANAQAAANSNLIGEDVVHFNRLRLFQHGMRVKCSKLG